MMCKASGAVPLAGGNPTFTGTQPPTMKPAALLILSLFLATSVSAQKKGKVDAKDLRIDSLTQVTRTLTTQLDSTNKELARYHGVYDAMKTKVIKYDFAPERTGALIDSLRAGREEAFSGMVSAQDAQAAASDTVTALRAEIEKMKAAATSEEEKAKQKAAAVADLKELKSLLDQKIITQAEFDSRKVKLLDKL